MKGQFYLAVPMLLALAFSAGKPAAEAEEAVVDKQNCLMCHSNPAVTGVLETPHFASGHPDSPGEQGQCLSCHEGARDHMANPMAKKPLRFGKDSKASVAEQNGTCLGCHEKGQLTQWHDSTHSLSDVACADCHQVHQPGKLVPDRSAQLGFCVDCHLDKRQAFRRRSHHPVEEGLVACADCHNPHGGSGPSQLREVSVNDTCYQCHGEKRGPFLWEHPPAADDCTNCHEPHGSVQPKLLTQRPPFLCQQCHSEPFHPGTLRSGTGLPGTTPDNKLLGGACVNCHSQVHGSNHPSGAILTR